MSPMKVLIVGSGPVGATFARLLSEDLPHAEILMVEAGPGLTSRYGVNLKNLNSDAERAQLQIRSQGPAQFAYPNLSIHQRANAAPGQLWKLARAGTHLVTLDEEQLSASGMPAAAMSTNVGGMGAHWTCASPRPGKGEAVEFIPAAELNEAFTEAEWLSGFRPRSFKTLRKAMRFFKPSAPCLTLSFRPSARYAACPLRAIHHPAVRCGRARIQFSGLSPRRTPPAVFSSELRPSAAACSPRTTV